MAMVAKGLCQCGCGALAPIAQETIPRLGIVKGEPRKFIHGHHARVKTIQAHIQASRQHLKGNNHPRYSGGKYQDTQGYIFAKAIGHPRANSARYVQEHILIAERAIGKFLPITVPVHHVNLCRSENKGSNLVICQDHAYHMFLHLRTNALRATGNPNARKCTYCQRWGMDVVISKHGHCYHLSCSATNARKRRVTQAFG